MSTSSHNIEFPVLVIINGKRYSPSSFPPLHSHLRFKLYLNYEPHTGCPELKLHMLAPRDIWTASNPAGIYDHPVSFFFPARGIFRWRYLSATESRAAAAVFGVSMETFAKRDAQSSEDRGASWRMLEFGAEEMAVDAGAIERVPRLRNEEAAALVKRLLGTVKHAIETPSAVLEVKCLIYDADIHTDDVVAGLEEALVSPPKTPPPATLSPSKRSPIMNWVHLKTRYKDALDARPTTSSSSSTSLHKDKLNSASQPPKTPARSSPRETMFQNNSPPTLRFLTPGKRVCFNCYDVGHREDVCEKPKRILGNHRQAVRKSERRKLGKKGGGGGGSGHGGIMMGAGVSGGLPTGGDGDDDDVETFTDRCGGNVNGNSYEDDGGDSAEGVF